MTALTAARIRQCGKRYGRFVWFRFFSSPRVYCYGQYCNAITTMPVRWKPTEFYWQQSTECWNYRFRQLLPLNCYTMYMYSRIHQTHINLFWLLKFWPANVCIQNIRFEMDFGIVLFFLSTIAIQMVVSFMNTHRAKAHQIINLTALNVPNISEPSNNNFPHSQRLYAFVMRHLHANRLIAVEPKLQFQPFTYGSLIWGNTRKPQLLGLVSIVIVKHIEPINVDERKRLTTNPTNWIQFVTFIN